MPPYRSAYETLDMDTVRRKPPTPAGRGATA
jgi:hypothetical protein